MDRAFVVVDLGFGDAGKGTVVDWLTNYYDADLIVRYNGGPQAGHNVVTAGGEHALHHTFSQFGSGMLTHPTVRTFLSQYMLINPFNLLREAQHLEECGVLNVMDRLFIDPSALVITPFHILLNQLRERSRGANRHGSCGQGVGEAKQEQTAGGGIQWVQLTQPIEQLTARLRVSQEYARRQFRELEPKLEEMSKDEWWLIHSPEAVDVLAEDYRKILPRFAPFPPPSGWRGVWDKAKTVIFEGAQGVLLDEAYGFQPYNTWATTTPLNAHRLLRSIGYSGPKETIGVMRSYMVRHGPGPFPTEDASMLASLPEPDNSFNPWQRSFRVGHLDLRLLRYAVAACSHVDWLAVTHLDRHAVGLVSESYDFPDDSRPPLFLDLHIIYRKENTEVLMQARPRYEAITDPEAYLRRIYDVLNVPIRLLSVGPTEYDKRKVKIPSMTLIPNVLSGNIEVAIS